MYLTKMVINARRRGARLLMASPQALHAAVMASFANGRPTDDGRVLWRLDVYNAHRVVLYTVSPDKPDFTHIVEQAGWPTTEAWETRCYDPLLESLRSGQHWQFRLTANPVRSGLRKGWTDTKPLGHVTVKQQEYWLIQRSQKAGFRLVPSTHAGDDGDVDLAVVDRSIRRFRRKDGQVTIATATFEGHLEVTDPEALRWALTRGIGRAKSYGCGLLTLAHPRASRP
ncbi:CRISPR-associated Cse3 family protein [Mycobacterium xenopi RIVM700367]|uniref:type I-E CRISPR-associated protein Cas6/Cse3/CasE n=1 Tax=Mycobacterium xenopi TaxID=1789 RepID=UPI00025AE6A2|nr:type I-E CRISPR-associated protein Cas6/Cse3/CasE [Mycobacterium xenopi]EID12769.1 CRISPR-associated Cse3 family protein [Mycobacterium xenopi RIVM700367]